MITDSKNVTWNYHIYIWADACELLRSGCVVCWCALSVMRFHVLDWHRNI